MVASNIKSTIEKVIQTSNRLFSAVLSLFNIHETGISDQSVIFLRDLVKSINKAIMNLQDNFVIRKPCK